MVLLKNHRAWKRFVNKECNIIPTDDKGRHNGAPPREFPCYAYLTVASYGYEEQNIHYLYVEDIANMYVKLMKAIQ